MTERYWQDLATLKHTLNPLSGNGIRLRLLTVEDLPFTLSWRNREDIRHQFIHSDIIDWENHLAWWKNYKNKSDDFVFIIEDTEILKRPVGQISIYNIDLQKLEAEYGRLMIGDIEAKRKGWAKKATNILVNWAFEVIKLNNIYLNVLKTNTVATNLYQQCGFSICSEHDSLYMMRIWNTATV
jgi:RimJ/RimL family protein N-acetyltransferase